MAYLIPNIPWRTYIPVEEPLTDNEKKEAFEVNLYIEIFGPQEEEENPLAIVMSKT